MSLAELLRPLKPVIGAALVETLVFGYLRVSHRRSAEKNLSPETQRQLIEDYAASKGYKIARWYEDMATSAFRDDAPRPEYERMLADAKG